MNRQKVYELCQRVTLVGGMEYVKIILPEEAVNAIIDCAVEEAVEAVEKRINEIVVRCKDCESWDTEHSSGRKSLGNYVCICQEWSDAEDSRWVCTGEDEYCSRGERRAKMEVQDGQK